MYIIHYDCVGRYSVGFFEAPKHPTRWLTPWQPLAVRRQEAQLPLANDQEAIQKARQLANEYSKVKG